MVAIRWVVSLTPAAARKWAAQPTQVRHSAEPLPRDSGFSLVELIVTVGIMGVAFLTLLSGFFSMTVVSAANRDQVQGLTYAKQYVELIESEPFANCPAAYSVAGLPTPAGWAAPTVTIGYWDPAAASTDVSNPLGAFVAGCPSGTAVQRIRVTMTTTDGRTSVLLDGVKRPW